MQFFSDEHIEELAIHEAEVRTTAHPQTPTAQRLHELHDRLYAQMQIQNIDLHIITAATVVPSSVSTIDTGGVLCIAYLRHRTQAVTVERLMGREEVASVRTIDAHRHPVIELRLNPAGLALELLLSPDAWWDQQNFMGKLGVARHRQEFYSLLQGLDAAYCMGFWQGAYLSDMHLTAHQFQHPRIMDEWMSTFEPGADWWRLGVWYDFDDERLHSNQIADELLGQIRALYALYAQLLWTSDNNYREFYKKRP